MPAPKRSQSERRNPAVCKAIVIAVQPPEAAEADVHRSLSELKQLLLGLDIAVVAEVVQKRSVRSSPAYLGEGKLRELAALTGGTGEIPRGPDARRADRAAREQAEPLVVVADDELSPGQLRNLQGALGVEVLDRTAVILRVFASRARTREARLEIELARLEYELPRIRDDHTLGDREGGGGRASRGHTNVELAKQRIRDRMAAVRRELEQLEASAAQRRLSRADTFRVALVGYTNAGKSSIMRQLTGSEVLVEDRLFATLGTTVRPLAPPATPAVLVADTVGFIHRLPHALVASFRSTLTEAREAWLLLHVVDAADPAFRAQIRVTEQVLADIGAAETEALLVLNKADRLGREERDALAREHPGALLMSALDRRDGDALRARIDAFFAQHLVEQTVSVPYARRGVLAELRDRLQVVREEYGEEISVTVRGTPEALGKLAARLAGG
ncbi:GTPase HflX [Sorangium sp. So ce1097]|uniref:GTPase HflX n=1 Tax=Sorangium sp. So ce1097 TaxID=3133330 RepID=UPI003F60864F